MDLTEDAAARQLDAATVLAWTVLATVGGDATEYRVCTANGDTYHVVECPDGPSVLFLAVSEHGDYATALRAIAAVIEEEEPAEGYHATHTVDLRPRLRIRRTWYCDTGPHAGKFGIGLEPLYVWPGDLEAIREDYAGPEDAGC